MFSFIHSSVIKKNPVVTQLAVTLSFLSPSLARQETRIRASEKDPQSKAQNICISNQYGGEEVTHTLSAEGREDTHRWMEAFWQHFYDMSELGAHAHAHARQLSPRLRGSKIDSPVSQHDRRPVAAVLRRADEDRDALAEETSAGHAEAGLPLSRDG